MCVSVSRGRCLGGKARSNLADIWYIKGKEKKLGRTDRNRGVSLGVGWMGL